MITRINYLRQFGIFTNFDGSGIKEFGKSNLVYGWNGTGKSTLSNLFSCLETRSLPQQFSTAKFSVEEVGGQKITEKSLPSSQLNVRVFNQRFIQENIDWDRSVKSVLLIAKEKIQELRSLEILKAELKVKRKALADKEANVTARGKAVDSFLTDTARMLKIGLNAIDTRDKYYFNYDRKKLSDFIASNSESIFKAESILTDKKYTELTDAARPDQLADIYFQPAFLKEDYYQKATARIRDLIKTTAANLAIVRLTANPNIRDWVQVGLGIHSNHLSQSCEFCGSVLNPVRVAALEGHFSKDFKDFQDRLQRSATWIASQGVQVSQLPSATQFYKEFGPQAAALELDYADAVEIINNQIKDWRIALEEKIKDPTRTDIEITEIDLKAIATFNGILTSATDVVAKHNNKSKHFIVETDRSKKSLELHHAASEMQNFGYADTEKIRLALISEVGHDKQEIQNISDQVLAMEAQLSNETIGALEFNSTLHRFIGRSDLCLIFNRQKKGYEIIRNGIGEHDGNLSEGEKTAIAFVYFITKLKENGNAIKDSVIVVDDPVSSFDSNHLFHAYSFLRTQCEGAKQLFVMTHNFTYYKLIRDWFSGKNKNRMKGQKPENCFFYRVESPPTLPRYAKLMDADDTLKNYGSEYHYIFRRLHEYKENATLNRDEAFLAANLGRRLVEAFFSFKYPKQRSDFRALLNSALGDCSLTTPEIQEKIYRFISKYSHSDVIEMTQESSENLIGESHSVVGDIFRWIEEVDKKHYDEMVFVSTNE